MLETRVRLPMRAQHLIFIEDSSILTVVPWLSIFFYGGYAMTKTWIEEYLSNIDGIPEDDLIEPSPQEIDPRKDTIVGEMNLHQRRLYTLWQKAAEKADRIGVEAKYARKEPERSTLHEQFAIAADQARTIEDVFWFELRRTYKVWGKSIGIRKDRVVVSQEIPPTPHGFLQFGIGLDPPEP